MKAIRTLLVAALLLAAAAATSSQQPAFNKERVTYKSGDLLLVGFLYRPSGTGPFPTVIWNHGSEKNPGGGPQFDAVATIFVPAGYAVFAPTRRGHGASEGIYIVDTLDALRQKGEMDAANRLMVRLLESEQLDDQIAGLSYAKKLPFVDASRMVVAGCSFGGIQTLLAVERGLGFKAAFSISPAALTWDGNSYVRRRLISAVSGINVPVLLIQPPKDPSLEPARVLGDEATRLRKRFTAKVYPPTMPDSQQLHCFGGAQGMHNWAAEAVTFFDDVLGRAR
jgi:carboxymethylenebutenolidase